VIAPASARSAVEKSFQVIIVGAGPAGIGIGAALRRCGVEDFLIVDAREPGASFASWPREMRMITPSFYSNAFGLTDLNAIDPETSPADFLRTQHPTGPEYARYLQAMVEYHELPVRCGVHVTGIRPGEAGFTIETKGGPLTATMVVWAAGQFFQPKSHDFPGAADCLHASAVGSWKRLEGEEFTIIGGYESGMDAAVNLCSLGKNVRLLSRGEPWQNDSPDPSRSLSPRTLDRIRELLTNKETRGKLELVRNTDIRRVEKGDHWWVLYDQDDVPTVSRTRPILANGYEGSLTIVGDLFASEDGHPVFSEACDESTITPGLFYSGPELVHRNSMFCFIYKFRSRFGLIAREIATRLGIADADELLESYAVAGFMNEDLECCTSCECAVDPVGKLEPDTVAAAG
jgi:putative flavoprotein involved in K+ transport